MDKKQKDEPLLSSLAMMKDAVSPKSELNGVGARVCWFGIGAVLLPFEAAKVVLEALGVNFDTDGDNNPYDL